MTLRPAVFWTFVATACAALMRVTPADFGRKHPDQSQGMYAALSVEPTLMDIVVIRRTTERCAPGEVFGVEIWATRQTGEQTTGHVCCGRMMSCNIDW